MSRLRLFFKNSYPVEVIGEEEEILQMRDEVAKGIRMKSCNMANYPYLSKKISSLPTTPCKYKYEKAI